MARLSRDKIKIDIVEERAQKIKTEKRSNEKVHQNNKTW